MLLLKDEDVQKVLTMPMTLEALDRPARIITVPVLKATLRPWGASMFTCHVTGPKATTVGRL